MAKGIEFVALKDWAAQREINHANVVLALELNGCLDRRNHGAVCAGAVLIEGAEVNEIRIGRDALERVDVLGTRRIRAAARHNAGHMGAVTVFIVRFSSPVERLRIRDARCRFAGNLEILIIADTTVDHRHANSRSVPTLAPRDVGIYG